MDWFRWYTGASTDPKFQVVARRSRQNVAAVVAVWAMMLERASESGDRGSVDGFDCEGADAVLGLEDGAACAIVDALKGKGLIVNERVAKWEMRQSKREDGSAERAKAWREQKKAEKERDGTHANASERTRTHSNARGEEIREEERQGKKDNPRARVDRPSAPEVLPPELPEDEPTAPVQGLKTKRASSDPACYAAFQRVVSLWPDRKEIERAKRAWNALWEAGEIIPHAIEDAILDHKARDAEWADGCHPRLWRWLENRRWTEQPKERPAQAARASPSSAPPSPTRYQDLRDLEQRQERERMRAMKEQLDAESRSQADQGQPQRVQSAPHAESAIQPGRPGRPLPVDGGRPGRKALA